MTLTKSDLVNKISANSSSRNKSKERIETLLEIMKQTLASGEDIMISGFGKFFVKYKSRRKGRNPATGEDLHLAPRRVVTFHCSDVLKDKINGEN